MLPVHVIMNLVDQNIRKQFSVFLVFYMQRTVIVFSGIAELDYTDIILLRFFIMSEMKLCYNSLCSSTSLLDFIIKVLTQIIEHIPRKLYLSVSINEDLTFDLYPCCNKTWGDTFISKLEDFQMVPPLVLIVAKKSLTSKAFKSVENLLRKKNIAEELQRNVETDLLSNHVEII